MDILKIIIGRNIREARLEKHLSQEALAEMCGFANTTLSAYENGRKTPNLATIARVAKCLGVSIERLYYGDENNSFIVSEPDEGKKIVNAVYFLWESGVICYYENYMAEMYPGQLMLQSTNPKGDFLQLTRHSTPLKRLINSLNEFQRNRETFPDPEKYIDLLLASVAAEINKEIDEIEQ